MTPFSDDLAALSSDLDRADWLIRAPEDVIVGYAATLDRDLARAEFAGGRAYLAARLAATLAVRDAEGVLPQTIRMQLEMRRLDMNEAARKGAIGAPAPQGQAPVADVSAPRPEAAKAARTER